MVGISAITVMRFDVKVTRAEGNGPGQVSAEGQLHDLLHKLWQASVF
jgi:hypothetical protein